MNTRQYLLLWFCPFAYLNHTRLKSLLHKLSWIAIYFVPNSVLYCYFADINIGNIICLILGLCVIDLIYTNGYMQNDIITTKTEINPTLRLETILLERMRIDFKKFMVIRTLMVCLLLGIIYWLNIELSMFIGTLVVLLQALYILYNSNRNILNLYLIPFLSFIRFYGILLAFVWEDTLMLFALFALYPLPKFLEFSTQRRYKTSRFMLHIINDFDRFRVVYYGFYTLFFATLWWLGYFNDGKIFTLLGGYYLIFRLICLLALQKKSLSEHIAKKREANNPHKK